MPGGRDGRFDLTFAHCEDTVLFPLAERQLADSKQAELEEGFAMIENTKIGPGRHEEFHKMLDHLQGCYLK